MVWTDWGVVGMMNGLIHAWIHSAVMGFSWATGTIRQHLMLCKMITSISGDIYSITELELYLIALHCSLSRRVELDQGSIFVQEVVTSVQCTRPKLCTHLHSTGIHRNRIMPDCESTSDPHQALDWKCLPAKYLTRRLCLTNHYMACFLFVFKFVHIPHYEGEPLNKRASRQHLLKGIM